MTPSPRSLTAATLAVVASCTLAASAEASIPVEPLVAAAPSAAYAGTAMWSRLDAASGKYQLVQSIDGGAATVVGVPQRDGAFDIDLGSGRNGSTYAVYTRGGDIYRFDPRTATEKKLTGLSSKRAERSPTIQRGRIAFLRRVPGNDQLRIGDTAPGAKGTRLLAERKTIYGIELGDKQIAWIDSIQTHAWSSRQRVHIRNLATGRDRVVYYAGSGGASFSVLTKPSFTTDGASFVWARSRIGTAGSRIVKYTLRSGELSYAQGSPAYQSVAWIDDKLGALVSTSVLTGFGPASQECGGGGRNDFCAVQYTGPLTFNLKP
jgi:hypothetical protein